MPITSVTSDAEALTLTVVGDYPVPVERLWEAYADPRQLEKFWGPESWPATFTRHDVAEGGRSAYYMTGPDGSSSHGWWRFVGVESGRRMEIEDGFSHEDGRPDAAGDDGERVVVDGPFTESKEVVGGFTIIDVPDLDAAIAMARTWPSLKHPGHSVEIRPIVEHGE